MMNIKSPRSIIILAIVFGLTFVALDILIDVTFFYNESFPENILSNKGELVFRILFLSCFLFFGAFIFEVFRKQKAMQNALIQTNRAAEDERAKLKAVLDNLGVGVIIQGLDYKVQYENRFQQESFGNHVGEICYKAYEGLDDLCPH
ncbi:MAG: hypothetical protein GWN77_00610, partial [Gammaproteobacteria bacterium]|nr:hypothetical protein [Gammaproteobacteria bacterium]